MRLSLSLDKELLEEAQRLLERKSKKRVIEEALKELIRKKRREGAIKHAGSIKMDITLEDLLKSREEG